VEAVRGGARDEDVVVVPVRRPEDEVAAAAQDTVELDEDRRRAPEMLEDRAGEDEVECLVREGKLG
jgi:hypothetical protein